jgi:phosphate transport system substrate-binding protein
MGAVASSRAKLVNDDHRIFNLRTTQNHTMNRRLIIGALAASLLAATGLQAAVTLNGSGATFPAPLYIRWAADFKKTNPDTTVNYQGVGSGAGVKQFTDGITDFGASDVAMSDAEIAKVQDNVLLLPATAGTIVMAYNLPGVAGLKLSRQAIAGILLGTVKTWDDALIAKENPGVKLPSLPVTVVTRADGSGTTAVFTAHIAAISPDFASKVGSGKQVTWPVGVSGKGNDGVTALIKQTPGAIGYVEYGYAANNKLSMSSLQNKSGNFIAPTIESGAATLASVTLPANFRAFITDPEGANDYPIATFTWLLVKKSYTDAAKASAIKAFVKYGLTTGQQAAPELGYITLPSTVAEKVLAALDSVK